MPLGHWTVGRLGRESRGWWYPHILLVGIPLIVGRYIRVLLLESPQIPLKFVQNPRDFGERTRFLQPQWPNRLLPCPALGLEFTNKNGRSAMSTPNWSMSIFVNKLAGLYLRSVLRNNCLQYAKCIKSNVRGILGWKNVCAANFETRPRFRLKFFHFSKVLCSMYCFPYFFCWQKHCQLLEKTSSMNL